MTSLFQFGTFDLASGQASDWKIECDNLTQTDWAVLAHLAAQRLAAFNAVVAVPTGGKPFAIALMEHRTEEATSLLICDDVLTTGGSMERKREQVRKLTDRPVFGVCAFARGPCPNWVIPVWSLDQ